MKKMIVTMVLVIVCMFANAQTLSMPRTKMYEVTTVEQLLATYGDAYITRIGWQDSRRWFYCQTADGCVWKADASSVERSVHYKSGRSIMENYNRLCCENYRNQMREIGARSLPISGVGYPVYGGGSGVSVHVGSKNGGVGFSIGNGGVSVGVNSKHVNAGVSVRKNSNVVFDAATGTFARR